MNLGQKLRVLRKEQNWTQQELGDRLGVAISTVSSYEANKREPDAKMLKQLAKLFGISVDSLLDVQGEEKSFCCLPAAVGKRKTFRILDKRYPFGFFNKKATHIELLEAMLFKVNALGQRFYLVPLKVYESSGKLLEVTCGLGELQMSRDKSYLVLEDANICNAYITPDGTLVALDNNVPLDWDYNLVLGVMNYERE